MDVQSHRESVPAELEPFCFDLMQCLSLEKKKKKKVVKWTSLCKSIYSLKQKVRKNWQ